MSHSAAGKPRGYAFIEYEHKNDMKQAYKMADGRKIEDRRVLVDVERGRTVPHWYAWPALLVCPATCCQVSSASVGLLFQLITHTSTLPAALCRVQPVGGRAGLVAVRAVSRAWCLDRQRT